MSRGQDVVTSMIRNSGFNESRIILQKLFFNLKLLLRIFLYGFFVNKGPSIKSTVSMRTFESFI